MKNFRVRKRQFRSSLSFLLSFSLLTSLLTFVGGIALAPQAAATTLATCSTTAAAQNNIRVSPSHASVFYIDTGVTPRIDASYVGYQVANTTGIPLKGYWVSLTNFVGGQVSLANPADQYLQLPDIAGNDTETVYFLLKASASTKVSQSHDVKVWNKRPDGSGAANPYGCTYSFKKVAETIKAAANKPISTVVGAIGGIGTTFKVTVQGATGTIGQGNPDVGRILYFTPAAYSSFPTRAFRLEKVTLAVTTSNGTLGNGTDYRFYNDQLLVSSVTKPDASTAVSFNYGNKVITLDDLVGKRKYQNEYTFRILSRAPSTTISPIAQISSGTQIKHTAIDANGTGTINATAVTVSASIIKQINSTSYSSYPAVTIGSSNYNEVPYKITLSSSTSVTTDEIVDTPPTGAIYKIGSAQLKIGSGAAATIADPETLTSESSMNPRPLHFVGPFTTSSSSSIILTYTLYVPAITGTYTNTAYAKIGDQQVVASSRVAIPGLTVTVGGDGKVSGSTETSTALSPVPTTTPATAIANTSTTINGSIDANGATTTGFFEWSTSATLSTYTSISLGSISGSEPTLQSSSLTGLTSGTTYYFRIVTVSSAVRYAGEIFSFTTYEPASTPVVITTTPSNISITTATLNASVDPNLQSVTQIDFILSQNSDMSSPLPTFTVFDLDEDGAPTTTKTTLAGASPTDISRDVSGLLTTTTYYYYAVITYGSAQTVSGLPTKKSFKTGSTAQEISFAVIADQPFSGTTFLRTPIASSVKSSDQTSTGLTVNYTSESTGVCTVSGNVITFVSVGFCVITATQAGNATYSEAEPVTRSFQITPSAPTATTQAATSVLIRSATINGDFTTGGGGSTSITFTYGTDSGLSGATTTTTLNSPSVSDGSRSMNLTGLSPSTTYHFRISASNSTGSATGNILQFTTAALTAQTITWTTISGKTYGDTATASAAASSGLTTTITSVTPSICTVPGGSISGSTVTLLSTGDCVLRAAQSGNDTFAAAANVDETFTVSAKPITVTAAAKTKVFGTADPALTYTLSESLVAGDSTSGSLARSAGTNVGEYAILIGTFTLSANYTLTYVGETLTITAKPLTIRATDKTRAAGESEPAFTYTITGLVSPDSISAVVLKFPGNVTSAPTANGSYIITPDAQTFSTGSASNYAITYETGTYTISSLLPQVLTWTTITSKVYGDTATATVVSDRLLPVTVISLTPSICTVPASSLSGATVTILGIGTCQLRASQAGDGTYAPANSVDTSFVISQALLTITATVSSTSITFGDSAASAGYSRTALVGSDAISSVPLTFTSGAPTYNSTAVPSRAGAYTITPGLPVFTTGAAANYTITYVTVSYQIVKKALSITASSHTVTVGDTAPTITATYSAFGFSEGFGNLTGTQTCTTTYTSSSIAGTYASSCSGYTSDDYTINYVAGVVTANAAGVTTYTVTYNLGGGSGTTPTETPKASGEVFTTAASSGFSRGGYTFTGWLCGGTTYAALASITMGSANLSCTAQWSQNAAPAATPATPSTPAPVVKQKPTIRWNNPPSIFVGTPLSGTQLDSILSVPGTCVYTPAIGTLLAVGTYTLSVTCTPTDGVNYEPVTATVTIDVKPLKKRATILWFNPSSIFNPTPLDGVQLDALGSVPGVLEYTPPAGTVLEPGSQVLRVKLKPTDPNIDEVETRVTILVKTRPANAANPAPGNTANPAPNAPATPTPATPGKPEVKEPERPKAPALAAEPIILAATTTRPVMSTAGVPNEVVTLTPNQASTGFVLSAQDWSISISSTTKFVKGNTEDSSARVVIESGNNVTTSGTGFKPNSQVDVYVYSTPTWLGAVITDEFGNFTTTLPMPTALPEGDHTFQAKGLTPDEQVRAVAVPITLVPAVAVLVPKVVKPGSLSFKVFFAMNSPIVSKAEKAKVAKLIKSAQAKIASDSRQTIVVTGWVQPNPNPGNIKFLSTNRAKNVAQIIKSLGFKGAYTLKFPGLDQENVPQSRHASVKITWSTSK